MSAPPPRPAPRAPTGRRAARLAEFPCTDAGNGEAFAFVHGGRVRFDHRRGRWLFFDGQHWRADPDGELRRLAKDTARLRLSAASAVEDPDRRKAGARWALASEARNRLDAMLELAKSERPVADNGGAWDAKPMLLGVTNGVVNLTTGALRPGRPADRITLVAPTLYRPHATCPRFERFLLEIFKGNADLTGFVQRAVGYSLTGDVSEQALFLLHGAGANGKSVLLNTLRRLLGGYGLNLAFSAFEMAARSQLTPELAMLPGKRLVTSSETNEGTRLNEARIKALTGGDAITANPKYQALFEFTPSAKFWLAVNHLPVVRDDSQGFWRRVLLIRFERAFLPHERDRKLEAKLARELPGILAWAVRGAQEWARRGLDPPASVRLATNNYRVDSDTFLGFIAECCVLGDARAARGGDLYRSYRDWAERAGAREADVLSHTMFGRVMSERFDKRQTNMGRVYLGIGLAADLAGDGSEG